MGAIDTGRRGRNKELGHVKRHNKRKRIDKLGTILNLTITLNIRLIQEALFGISNFYYKYSLKIQTT